MLHRQEIREEPNGQAIGHERGPSHFQTQQFWRAPLGEQRGDWTPTAPLLRLTETSIQARTGERQFAKEGSQANPMMPLVGKRLLAVRALTLLFYIFLNLVCHHDLLDTS